MSGVNSNRSNVDWWCMFCGSPPFLRNLLIWTGLSFGLFSVIIHQQKGWTTNQQPTTTQPTNQPPNHPTTQPPNHPTTQPPNVNQRQATSTNINQPTPLIATCFRHWNSKPLWRNHPPELPEKRQGAYNLSADRYRSLDVSALQHFGAFSDGKMLRKIMATCYLGCPRKFRING